MMGTDKRICFKTLFKSPEGKKVLAFLADDCGQFKSSFVAGDSHGTAFNEGKRFVFNHILALCSLDEDILRKIIADEQNRNLLVTTNEEYF